MKRIIVSFVVGCMTLSGCADNAQNVQATYTSPIAYQSYSCSQIGQEARRVSARVSQIAGVQDKNAQGDAVATGVALVLFWPAVFFIGGNKENAAELGRLKGELEALEQISIQKNCGIVFQKPKVKAPSQDEQETKYPDARSSALE